MILFIAGGGSKEDSKELDYRFSKLLSVKPVLYIPIAMDETLRKYSECENWFKSIFLPYGIQIDMKTDLKQINIKNYCGIYIGGGNTFKLLKLIKSSGFDIVLKQSLQNLPYYGGSAGAIILGRSITTSSDINTVNLINFEGLGILEFDIWPHYEESQELKIKKYSLDNNVSVLALSEKAGVIINNSEIEIIGDNVFFFKKSEKIKLSKDKKYNNFPKSF